MTLIKFCGLRPYPRPFKAPSIKRDPQIPPKKNRSGMRVICLFGVAGMLLKVCRLCECSFFRGSSDGIFVRLICKNLLDMDCASESGFSDFFVCHLPPRHIHSVATRCAASGKSDRP